MTSLATRTIDRLHVLHDALSARVATITDDELAGTSGAAEWDVAQVLSHLGSQSEIALAASRSEEPPTQEFNESVWARWDALDNRAKAEGFVTSSAALLASFDAVSEQDRVGSTVKLAFLPMPVPYATVMGLRLNEFLLHAWDVLGVVDEVSAEVLLEHYATGLGFMLGFTAKPECLREPAVVELPGLTLSMSDTVAVSTEPATAKFGGTAGQAALLIGGRLREDVPVGGNVTLEELRQVFPGY
jgi:uncharacterized protein (TIGR03083 family)